MTELSWDDVRWNLAPGRLDALQQAVTQVSEGERKVLAKSFVAYVRTEMPRLEVGYAGRVRAATFLPALAVAAIGLLPSEAAAATLLSRADVRLWWEYLPVERMVAVADGRGVPWLAELAGRLAATPGFWEWQPVAELIVATGAAAPTTDRFVRAWLSWVQSVRRERDRTEGEVLTERLLRGPFLDAFLPRLFDIDGLGPDLAASGDVLPEALVALVEQGRLERVLVLDGCLSRLQRADRPGALRWFTDLHARLAPTVDELAERAADYADLAMIAPSPVAGFGQQQLRILQAADRLETDLLLSTSPPVLERSEKVVVATQLKLLKQALRQHPDRAGEILRVIAQQGPGEEVQPDLPPGDVELPVPADRFGPWAAPFPAPIDSLNELRLLLEGPGPAGWIDEERVMAGLVALATDDPFPVFRVLNEAMSRLRESRQTDGLITWYPATTRPWPQDMAHFGDREFAQQQQATRIAREYVLRGDSRPNVQLWAGTPAWGDPNYFLNQMRISEVVAGLGVGVTATWPRHLLATPTDLSGRIDPVVLLARITAAENDGRSAFALDLQQALLRLPRQVDPEIAVRAARLHSPAAVALSSWLAGNGAADPIATVRGSQPAAPGTYRSDERPGGRRHVVLALSEEPRSELHRALFTVDVIPQLRPGGTTRTWPGPSPTFPDHREVIAAWALTDQDAMRLGDGAVLLPSGPDLGGAAGPALTLMLAYTFGAEQAANRVAAVDALLSLAGAGNLDGPGLGEHLGAMIADGVFPLTRVGPGLAEGARAGAGAATWDVIAAMLPYVIGGKPAGLPDLLALAVELATSLGRQDRIPGLNDVAARKGSGAAVAQARRLKRVLDGT